MRAGKLLKQWRDERGLSQKDFCRLLETVGIKMNQSTFSRIECGEVRPSLEFVYILSRLNPPPCQLSDWMED